MADIVKKDEGLRSQWFPDPASRNNALAHEVLDEHKSYVRKKLPQLGAKVKTELNRIVNADKTKGKEKDKESLNDQADILDRLNGMPLEALSTYVKSEIEQLGNAHSGLEEKRSKGIHKVNAKTQKFMSEFDRFLTAYSGIVNIVSLADAQYGGVATATLSLLFSTVMMKAKDEEAITSAMRQISDRLPDFQVYRRIYPDRALGIMLADAYKGVILLARQAILYFQDSTFGRHLRSMGKPLDFEIMEQNMREDFNRIRLKCETLLAQRVDKLVGQVEEMQKRNDRNLVMGLRNALQLGSYRPDEAIEELVKYREALATIFDKDIHRQKIGLAEFLDESWSQRWKSIDSVVLVLFGLNERGKSMTTNSWLSPLAVDLIKDHVDCGHMVGFDMCDESSTLETVLGRLILQLLERNPEAIRRAEDWHEIESRISRGKEDREEDLLAALLRLINLQKGPVYIILDRPELSEKDGAAHFIKEMLNLAARVRTQLKVLMAIRTDSWDVDNERNLVPRGVDKNLLQMIQLNQRRL